MDTPRATGRGRLGGTGGGSRLGGEARARSRLELGLTLLQVGAAQQGEG